MEDKNQTSATEHMAINHFSSLRFLTTSQECKVFEKLAWNDYTDIKDVQKKFFRHQPNDPQKSYYLKNKYLYLFTEGVINYLEALKGAEESSKKDLNSNEISTVSDHIFYQMDNEANSSISIVSLGSGTSQKEVHVINDLISKTACNFDYFPIDVSINLLQLSMLNFYNLINNEGFNRVKIHPIVADFWSLADYVKSGNNNLFDVDSPNVNRIFLLFGNTFGNYYENDLLDQIMPIMKTNDLLVIGLDIWDGVKANAEKEQQRIFHENSALEITQWLLHPLKYIPFYAGFLHKGKFLNFNKKDIMKYEQNQEKAFITNVKDTICYAPCLEVRGKISAQHGTVNIKVPRKIRIASTTKYNVDTLIKWFEEYRYVYGGKENQFSSVQAPSIKNNSAVFCLKKSTKEIDIGSGLADLGGGS